MRLKMIPNSGMIGKEERGSDGSRSLSSSSSPPVEGPESLQGQGFEPSSPTSGLYLCLDWLVFFHVPWELWPCIWMRLSSRAYSTYGRRTLSWVWVSQGSWMHAFLLSPPHPRFFFVSTFLGDHLAFLLFGFSFLSSSFGTLNSIWSPWLCCCLWCGTTSSSYRGRIPGKMWWVTW